MRLRTDPANVDDASITLLIANCLHTEGMRFYEVVARLL
jgi:hypothetical protein